MRNPAYRRGEQTSVAIQIPAVPMAALGAKASCVMEIRDDRQSN